MKSKRTIFLIVVFVFLVFLRVVSWNKQGATSPPLPPPALAKVWPQEYELESLVDTWKLKDTTVLCGLMRKKVEPASEGDRYFVGVIADGGPFFYVGELLLKGFLDLNHNQKFELLIADGRIGSWVHLIEFTPRPQTRLSIECPSDMFISASFHDGQITIVIEDGIKDHEELELKWDKERQKFKIAKDAPSLACKISGEWFEAPASSSQAE